MKHKLCALLLALFMAMSAGLFSACREEKQPSGDVNVTDPSGGTEQGGTQNKDPDEGEQKPDEGGESGPETPPAEEQATEGLHYTPIYGADNETVIGYNVGVGEAVDEEKIVIPAKHDGLPVLRIGMPKEFFDPWPTDGSRPDIVALQCTDKLNEEFSAYVEKLGYDPQELKWQELKGDRKLYLKVGISFCRQYAFLNSKAKTIKIPSSVTQIGFLALNFSGIESLYLPESVTKIENAFPFGLLSFCDKLTKVEVSEKNPVYHSEGNCLIETATKTAVAGCKTSVIPEGTPSIGYGAFSCIGLTGLTSTGKAEGVEEFFIPKSVTSIQNYAFSTCMIDRIVYGGTIEEWNSIDKLRSDEFVGWWANGIIHEVVCTNGTLTGSDIG